MGRRREMEEVKAQAPETEGQKSAVQETEEQKLRKRKDHLKNAIIAFLVIMLILTLFSNTFMNYTLPEVATTNITSGSISPQIRGTGTLSADDPYNVMVTETRTIASVALKVGAKVKKGDTIYYLEDAKSDEIKTKEKALEDARTAYKKALFTGDIDDETITDARKGKQKSLDSYQKKLKEANDAVDAAQTLLDMIDDQIALLTEAGAIAQADQAYDLLTPEYEAALITQQLARAEREADQDRIDHLKRLQEDQARIKSQLTTYAAQLSKDNEKKQATLTYMQTCAKKDLEKAQKDKEEVTKGIGTEIDLNSQKENIANLEQDLAEMKKKAIGATIDAPIDGTISSLALSAGQQTSADTPVAVIQRAGQDMTFSFTVKKEQAQKLHVGDEAQPQNPWQYTEFSAKLKSISPDQENPTTMRKLTFLVKSPEVENGQSVSVKMGESSKDYDMVVPNSSIREDNNGKFVLIVSSKSSPLGNRYIAKRLDVEVLASDDTKTAINAVLEDSYDTYVITTSTAPVKAGDQVRLSNADAQ